MHGTSLPGVSFTRLAQPDDEVAPIAGAVSPTRTQSDNSHGRVSRDTDRRAIATPSILPTWMVGESTPRPSPPPLWRHRMTGGGVPSNLSVAVDFAYAA